MTQKEKILKLFRKSGWVKVQTLQQIAWRFSARLYELRKEGYEFEKRRQKNGLEEWKLISNK